MQWYRADKLPKEYEGRPAWKYVFGPGPIDPYCVEVVPRGYSRDPHHCEGVYFWPLDYPPKPDREDRT